VAASGDEQQLALVAANGLTNEGTGAIAFTGSDIRLAAAGAMLLLAGVALMVAARRRRRPFDTK
jgi:hypothetical protein